MPQKPEQTSLSFAPNPAPAPESAPGPVPQRIPRWLERVELILRVLVRVFIGQWLIFAPWTLRIWDQNPLFLHYPSLGQVATNGAVRGLVSGLGVLNLWIALHDVIRHRNG
jgi:hypothetical protein